MPRAGFSSTTPFVSRARPSLLAQLDTYRAALTTFSVGDLERGQQWLSSVRTDGNDVTSFGDQSIPYMGINHGIDDGSAASLSLLVTEALRRLRADAATVARLRTQVPTTGSSASAEAIMAAILPALEEAPSGFAIYEDMIMPRAMPVETLLQIWQRLEHVMDKITKGEGHKVRALQRYILADAQLITEKTNLLTSEESALYPPHVYVQRQSLARGYDAPFIARVVKGVVASDEAAWLRPFLQQLIVYEAKKSRSVLPLSQYRRLVIDLEKLEE